MPIELVLGEEIINIVNAMHNKWDCMRTWKFRRIWID